MKLKGNRIRTSKGKILHFKSARKRNRWERIAKAIRGGWKPTGRGRKR